MDEIEKLHEETPEASAYYATSEMHQGRLEWLAEHIRRCDFQISPIVAKKLLHLLDGSDPNCLFELKAVRKAGLPPRASDPRARLARDFDLAVEVARLGGFKRAYRERVCAEVAERQGMATEYVIKCVRKFAKEAQEAIAEEEMQAAYHRGEMDILEQPKSP